MTVLRRLEVFAVEDTTAQLTWRDSGAGTATFEYPGGCVEVELQPGPGAVTLPGLPVARSSWVHVRLDGRGVAGVQVTTIEPPPGAERTRIGLVSDLHLGQSHFGVILAPREPDDHPDPADVRCARAALHEAVRWGADLLVIKGDAVDLSTEQNWATLAGMVADIEVPIVITTGNHEKKRHNEVPPRQGARQAGVVLEDHVGVRDLPGIRLILADTAIEGSGWGTIAESGPAILEAAAVESPVLVATHHNFMPRNHPTVWPPGIPAREGLPFLKALGDTNPDVMVTSGHTHRNRRFDRSGVITTEIAGTRDYPGCWAGYVVHDGGIRQVVHRIEAPEAIRWTERTRRAGFGMWGLYAPGWLRHRSFSHRWRSSR